MCETWRSRDCSLAVGACFCSGRIGCSASRSGSYQGDPATAKPDQGSASESFRGPALATILPRRGSGTVVAALARVFGPAVGPISKASIDGLAAPVGARLMTFVKYVAAVADGLALTVVLIRVRVP